MLDNRQDGITTGNQGIMSHTSPCRCMLVVIVIVCVQWRIVRGGCTFPSDIRDKWTRSRDSRNLTFTNTQVSGMSVKWNTQTMDPFLCHSTSGNKYVIYANYTGLLGTDSYYVCWELVRVTANAYIIYDLSGIVNGTGFESGRNGYVLPGDNPLDITKACSKSVTTEFFSTLIKSGSTSNDVAVACPSVLNATFSYGTCPTTALDFCPNGKTGVMDYTACTTLVFRSVSGQVTCMGQVARGTDIYLNLFEPGSVICWRVPDKGSNSISVEYFTGDCTTVNNGGSDTITLTQTKNCDLTTTTASTTTTTPSTVTTKSTTSLSSTDPSATTAGTKSPSSSSDSAAVGVGVGVSFGVIALIALCVLAVILIRKNNLMVKVADLRSKQKASAEKKKAKIAKNENPENSDVNPIINGRETITRPNTRLPPITNGKAPPPNG
ncbi:unnamed protein product [Lymnaea stagnalis]|uniref:Uncharacterized protein n=1 Tax=Lymnaea stagnalis TaxID=6523 RepID=A0AAV2HXE5_LYMST